MIRFHNRVVDTLARVGPAGTALRHGAGDRHEALPVDDPHRLPAADLRAGRRQRRLHQRPEGVRGRGDADRRPDDADRVLGRRVPARPLDGPRAPTTGTRSSTTARHARPPVRVLGAGRRPRRRNRACRASGSPTSGGSTTSARRAASPASSCRRPSSTGRCASTRCSSTPLPRPFPARPAPTRTTSPSATSRGRRWCRLATGQQMVTFLKSKGVNVTKLTNAQIRDGKNGAKLDALTQAQRAALLKDTPLWFYILREAELNGGKLKGVGARIVAETFHRAMEGSQFSIVRDPTFDADARPEQLDLPHGRPAALRVRGEEDAPGAAGLAKSEDGWCGVRAGRRLLRRAHARQPGLVRLRERDHRKARRLPAPEAADEVRRPSVAELAQVGRCEARRVAVGAEEDEPSLEAADVRVRVARVGVDAPLEDRAGDMDRPGDDPRPACARPASGDRRGARPLPSPPRAASGSRRGAIARCAAASISAAVRRRWHPVGDGDPEAARRGEGGDDRDRRGRRRARRRRSPPGAPRRRSRSRARSGRRRRAGARSTGWTTSETAAIRVG